jgi:hypothetical protein
MVSLVLTLRSSIASVLSIAHIINRPSKAKLLQLLNSIRIHFNYSSLHPAMLTGDLQWRLIRIISCHEQFGQ